MQQGLFAALSLAAVTSLSACAPRSAAPALAGDSGEKFELVVASTTDVHGHLRGWDYYGAAPDPVHSLAAAATVVDSVRRDAPGRVILVDAGDLLQGTPLAYVAARVDSTGDHPVIAAMNAMAYDAAAVGNHEFNYGLPALRRATAQARFPFLAANVRTPAGARAFPAFRVVRRGPVRVAIVGATTPGSAVWDRDKLEGKLVFADIVPEVRRAVTEARRAGADVVIVSVHSGLDGASSYDTVTTRVPSENVAARVAKEVEGIDLLVYGHSHRQMADTVIGTTLLMQPKNWAQSVGVARLALARGDGRWRVVRRSGVLVPTRSRAEDSAVLAASRAKHERTLAYVASPVATTAATWRSDSTRVADTPILDLVLDIQRRLTGADLAATSAFSVSATIDSGTMTIADLAQLYPYENTLKVVRITGRQLRDYLEYTARYFGRFGSGEPAVDPKVPGYNFDVVAGAEYTIDVSRPVGSRVTRLVARGRPVADTDSFTLALHNYRQSGGGGYAMLRGAPVISDGNVEIRQLLIEEARRRGAIQPSDVFTRNWELVPAAAIAPIMTAISRDPFERGRNVPAGGKATRIRVVSTNDFHGALRPRADTRGTMRGGAAHVATAVARAREECGAACAFLLVDGGDMFQGTPISNFGFGKPVVETYNAMGYAAAALGNHEFDWGVDSLRARMRDARYAILGANVRYADGRDVEWVPNDTIVERGGLRIGIVGIASVLTPGTTRASNVAGLRFAAPAPIVDSTARALRARGADAIVVLAHDGAYCDRGGRAKCGGEIIDFARALTEKVEAIVSGHTHSLVETVVNGIPIVQARTGGTAIGVVDVPLDGGSPAVEVRDVLTDSLPAAPAIDSIIARAWTRVADRVNEPVARIAATYDRTGPQYPLGNLIADAFRTVGKGDIGAMNNGGIRTALRQGTATWGQLFEIQPFGNRLHRVTQTGRDLRACFESLLDEGQPDMHISGARIVLDTTRAAGSRIVSFTLADGGPLLPRRRYTTILNDYMLTTPKSAACRRTMVKDEDLGIVDLDALIAHLRAAPQPVRAPSDTRITIRK